MGHKNKLKKFAEIREFENVYENSIRRKDFMDAHSGIHTRLKGHWDQAHFANNNPITLELACGKGEYSVGLASRYPKRNFIGVDVKGNRIWKGAKYALDHQLSNVAFLRTQIEWIPYFFEKGEVEEIWILFPDPYLRESRAKKRLTSSRFLDAYAALLNPGSILHLKTDDTRLYHFTKAEIEAHPQYSLVTCHDDIYSLNTLPHKDLDLITFYERMHLEDKKTIKYVQFRFVEDQIRKTPS